MILDEFKGCYLRIMFKTILCYCGYCLKVNVIVVRKLIINNNFFYSAHNEVYSFVRILSKIEMRCYRNS